MPTLPVVMFSGHGTIETAVAAIKKGAYDFIEKPFKSDRLLLVDRARDRGRASCGARTRSCGRCAVDETELIGTCAGHDPACARRSSGWRRPAAACMISGPPGSGKEVAAR